MPAAPPLPAGLPWLNVARPPALDGRLLLLHFFSAGCVQGEQAVPVLAEALRLLPGEPVLVVGIHTPRGPSDRGLEVARRAVLRLGLEHPVLVDDERLAWRAHGLRSWPTLVLVDPTGRRCGLVEGELEAALLVAWLRAELERARAEGQELEVSPLPLRREGRGEGPLVTPGALAVAGDRLFVADPGQGEVLELDLAAPGRAALVARHRGFGRPEGLAHDAAGGALFVADPGGQRVWRLDLASGARAPLAGTGALGRGTLAPGAFAPAAEVALRSPRGLAFDPARRRLHLSLAGAHQLWTLEVDRGRVWAAAGDGDEGRRDGGWHRASFTQPGALALAGDRLLVADGPPDAGAVRAVDFTRGDVGTLLGDDGRAELARPTALAALPDGGLVVADGPAAAVWRVSAAGRVAPLPAPGLELGEPAGLALHRGRLLLADAALRRVVAVGLEGGAWEVVAGAGSG